MVVCVFAKVQICQQLLEGFKVFTDAKILYAPGKASNAGGVATSGLEMSQNSMRLPWSREEVDKRLHEIMVRIHEYLHYHSRKIW